MTVYRTSRQRLSVTNNVVFYFHGVKKTIKELSKQSYNAKTQHKSISWFFFMVIKAAYDCQNNKYFPLKYILLHIKKTFFVKAKIKFKKQIWNNKHGRTSKLFLTFKIFRARNIYILKRSENRFLPKAVWNILVPSFLGISLQHAFTYCWNIWIHKTRTLHILVL